MVGRIGACKFVHDKDNALGGDISERIAVDSDVPTSLLERLPELRADRGLAADLGNGQILGTRA